MVIVTLSSLILPLCFWAPPGLVRGPLPLDTFQIDYLQATTDGAVDALSCYRPVQANVAADALPCRPPRKTFGASRFRSSRFRASPSRFRASHFQASFSRIRASLSKLDSHSFEPCTLEPHVFEPHVYERHSSGSTLSELCSHVFKPYFFEPHFFKPHPVGSLHFFDPNPIAPDPRMRNIFLVISVVRRVSKRASRQTYKANVGGIRLRLQGL